MVDKKAIKTLRDFRQTCRVSVLVDGKEKIGRLIMCSPRNPFALNISPIEDRVHLEPLGWFDTDKVELLDVLPWTDLKIIVQAIHAAHRIKAPLIEAPVQIKGKVCTAVGKSANMVDLDLPMLALLTEDSTPQFQGLANHVEDDFELHLRRLFSGGQPFYTVLRPNWALPAIIWEKQ